MNQELPAFWKRCSTCKKEIPYQGKYYLCSVSSCKHKRKGYRFCSVSCWDEHLAFANHREAWAEENQAPTKAEAEAESPAVVQSSTSSRAPVRKIVDSSSAGKKGDELDTLVVVSKVKAYISAYSDLIHQSFR